MSEYEDIIAIEREDGSVFISMGDPVHGPHHAFDIECDFTFAKFIAAAVALAEASFDVEKRKRAGEEVTDIQRLGLTRALFIYHITKESANG